jgi:SPP1 family phage portal protein
MLTTGEIKQFIDEDAVSSKKNYAKVGMRYYEGDHDILNSRFFYFDADGNIQEDKYRSNVKIPHPFFTELTDQLTAHMLSFDENPIQAKDGTDGLQDYLDLYFDERFWEECGELLTDTYTKGFGYMYAFKNGEDRLCFEAADSMGVIEVREQDTDDKCAHIIYYYNDRVEKGTKIVRKIQVWDDAETYYYEQVDSGEIVLDADAKINPRPHVLYTDDDTGSLKYENLGFMPFWRLDNNRKQISGLKPIKALIDDYDLMMCGLSNNVTDFDTPLHVVTGFQGDDLNELQQNLKTKKIVGVDVGGGIDIKTVNIPYQARQAKAEADEKAIYRFGFGLNMAGLKDTSATTNIAIKSAYSLLDMKANKLEKRLKRMLKEVLKVVIDEINTQHGTDYQLNDVKFDFERNLMVNEAENASIQATKANTKMVKINTLLNVAGVIGEDEAIKAVCDELDIDYAKVKADIEKAKEEQQTIQAQQALNKAVTAQ